ncbi:MAG TPA: hypothetical protein K8V08_11280 [Brevibacterium senegalense]|uniref:Uncharacterized protein n=1 Tax=Brevibacterium senegalense TaxID=1033736 RepID=A0A921SPK5_9MICO|nr:hypothetical protein [Brevibacterium senegalense]
MWDFAAIFALGVAGLLVISIAFRLLPIALIGTALFSWISIFGYGAGGWTWLVAIGSTLATFMLLFGGRECDHDVL